MTGKESWAPIGSRLATAAESLHHHPSRPESIIDLKGKCGGSHREGPSVSEKRSCLFQEQSGVCWLPGLRTFCELKRTNMSVRGLLQ